MKSEKGLTILSLCLIIIVLIILAGISAYTVIGTNGVLNPEEVEPLSTSVEDSNQIS